MTGKLVDNKNIAPDPTEEDATMLSEIVRRHLGENATANFMGVRARGNKGDGPFYARVIMVQDQNTIPKDTEALVQYYDRVESMRAEISNHIASAGNVVLDVTPTPDGLGGNAGTVLG